MLLSKKLMLKFTKASKKDARLVTLNLNQLKFLSCDPELTEAAVDWLNRLQIGSRIIVEIKVDFSPVSLLFTVNRCNSTTKTATTKAWPFDHAGSGGFSYICNQPDVGNPVEYELLSVEQVALTYPLID